MARSHQVVLAVVLATFMSIIHWSEAARIDRGGDVNLEAEIDREGTAPHDASTTSTTTPTAEVAKNWGLWSWFTSPARYAYEKAKNGYAYFMGKNIPREATPSPVKPCYSVGTHLLTDEVCKGVQGESESTTTEEFNKLVRHVHRRDQARSVVPDCTVNDLKQMCSFRAQSAKQQAVAGGATECAKLLNTWLDLLRTTNLLNASQVCNKDYKTFHRQGQRAARLMYRNQLRTFEAYMENTEKFQGRMEDQAFWPGLAYNMQYCLKDDASEDAMLEKAYQHVCGKQPPARTWTDRIINTWECCTGWFYGRCDKNETAMCSNSTDSVAPPPPCSNSTDSVAPCSKK